jgi:hypothetical protein
MDDLESTVGIAPAAPDWENDDMQHRVRGLTHQALFVSLAALTWLGLTGCDVPYGPQFREAALPSLQAGLTQILTGFVDGVFAAIEPEADGDDSAAGGSSP